MQVRLVPLFGKVLVRQGVFNKMHGVSQLTNACVTITFGQLLIRISICPKITGRQR